MTGRRHSDDIGISPVGEQGSQAVTGAARKPGSTGADPRDITPAEIERRFTYHRPEGRKITEHDDIRRQFKLFAEDIVTALPASREKSLAITALEESSMWAHAAIAREGK